MNNTKISVIIPIYNVENYLDKCIESVINQTYNNLEIILVDDGSTDNSSLMCDKWKEKDSRIHVFHKKNGGLSDARNFGIKKSTGDYLAFVDSDDYIHCDMYRRLLEGCIKNNVDIGCCNKVRISRKGRRPEKTIIDCKCIEKIEAMKLLLLSDPSVCNKIFKKSLFNRINFPIGKLYEDIITTPYLINCSNGMYLDNLNGYYYNQLNGTSIIHNSFSIKKMDYYYNLKELRNYIKISYATLSPEMDSYYILSLSILLQSIFFYKSKFKKQYNIVLKEMKKINYLNNNFIPFYKKIMLFLELNNMIELVIIAKRVLR